MSQPSSAQARVLASAAFRRARVRAQHSVQRPESLVRLLGEVSDKIARHAALRHPHHALDLDVVCAVVEAHVDECADNAQLTIQRSVTAQTRLRLAAAALHYLVDSDDVIPDSNPHGLGDDVLVLRWASHVVRGELPV